MHHVEFPHPLVILISLSEILQHGSGGSGRVCHDNHGAIKITTAQMEKLDRVTPNERYRLPSGVGGTHGIGAHAKKSAFFRCVRLVSTRYTRRWVDEAASFYRDNARQPDAAVRRHITE
jgi:hypothetical protein